MRILILGVDGYLGYHTQNYMRDKGHEVYGIDSFIKREIGEMPLAQNIMPGSDANFRWMSTLDYDDLCGFISQTQPEAIIHYAEIPSAPFSMENVFNARKTQENNISGTLNLLFAIKKFCPDTHLIKLASMGEYGSPGCDIPEGYIEDGPMKGLPFPKSPSSFYHLSKVHDSNNIIFACKTWGLRATDLNQGIVYGGNAKFQYDSVWGTALNRFIVQAVLREPITVYGSGNQRRAFLNIKDTLQCVELACLNPAEFGKMRVFNQFTQTFQINELAEMVSFRYGVEIEHLENPRIESEISDLDVKNTSLINLGLKPHLLDEFVLDEIFEFVLANKKDIRKELLKPNINWR